MNTLVRYFAAVDYTDTDLLRAWQRAKQWAIQQYPRYNATITQKGNGYVVHLARAFEYV